jgi:hypothetical protein
MKDESQNSERCRIERAEVDDDGGEARLGSASSCMSSCIMLNDCASQASSAKTSCIVCQGGVPIRVLPSNVEPLDLHNRLNRL